MLVANYAKTDGPARLWRRRTMFAELSIESQMDMQRQIIPAIEDMLAMGIGPIQRPSVEFLSTRAKPALRRRDS